MTLLNISGFDVSVPRLVSHGVLETMTNSKAVKIDDACALGRKKYDRLVVYEML